MYTRVDGTIGGRPYWSRVTPAGKTYYLYSISVPHDAWVIGETLDTHIATVESYEEQPPWGTVTWKEEFAAHGAEQQVWTARRTYLWMPYVPKPFGVPSI